MLVSLFVVECHPLTFFGPRRANTALAGLTRKYKNAFSIVAPLILDSAVITASDDSHVATRLRYLIKWGLTARGTGLHARPFVLFSC